MKKNIFPFVLLSALCLLLSASIASAHEHRVYQINGRDYSFTVGFLNEPVTVDDKSGIDFQVDAGNAAMMGEMGESMIVPPVDGLDKTLKVEVSAGSEKKILPLVANYGEHGKYHAVFYPSLQTTYSFRIFGTMNNVPVDVSYTCASGDKTPEDATAHAISDKVTQKFRTGGFGCPGAKDNVMFPGPAISLADLNQKIDDTTAQTKDSVSSANTKGLLGIVLGVVALGVAWKARKRV